MLKLTGLTLEGFKSFAADFSSQDLPGLPGRGRVTNRLAFGDVTVLVGPNGAGKSNIVSFFRMVSAMMDRSFREYVARSGFADSLLHYGSKKTPQMAACMEFGTQDPGDGVYKYEFHLAADAGDGVVFTDESLVRYGEGQEKATDGYVLGGNGSGSSESDLFKETFLNDAILKDVFGILKSGRPYHFHDTSSESGFRKSGYIEDAYALRSDGGNLAAFLHGMKARAETEPYCRRIESTVQLAFPQFGHFVLEPRAENERYILLNWRSRADDSYLFGPHQISDGALRFAAIAALLLQSPDRLPPLVVLDEPELGLHPSAIELLAEMIKGAAFHGTQILVATQSPQLVDQFDLDRIRPIEHRGGRSVILELDPAAYCEWLEEYSTGELWEKNIIGGGPTCG